METPALVCPMCGQTFWDESLTHCALDGTLLAPAGEIEGPRTSVDRIVGGRYRMVRKLAQGGMGSVYLAEQSASGRQVALKIIRPELESSAVTRERFLRECQMLESIHSPNVVQVLDAGQSAAGEVYLAMELLEGEGLGTRLHRGGTLDVAEAASIAKQVLSALAAAHDAGIVHRDLKPDNVFLCTDGSVRVLDFGIARLFDSVLAGNANRLTATGSVVGTPIYISPEAVAGRALGPPADLYSLGVILYEMITGSPPFWHENPVIVMGMHLNEEPRSLYGRDDVPDGLAALVERLLRKDPAKRPKSAVDVIGMLDAILAGEAPVITSTHSFTLTRKSPRWPFVLAGAIVLAGALIGTGLAWLRYSSTEPAALQRAQARVTQAVQRPAPPVVPVPQPGVTQPAPAAQPTPRPVVRP